ncbi:mannonate dehydratase [bacterium]|nr:MAG: mannonate dehydratase [bacterium]
MSLLQTWRWFGPNDPVSLNDIKMAGARGIVSALHHIPNGEIWTVNELLNRKNEIELAGLTWSVIESIPVHEDIKLRKGSFEKYIQNYKTSIQNAAKAGINVICYNFMPVLDWTRTQLFYEVADGSKALRFDMLDYIAFDVFVLMRKKAASSYTDSQLKKAKERFSNWNENELISITSTILAGLPGSEETYTLQDFSKKLAEYDEISESKLQEHLLLFLREIVPVSEENGVYLTIHPDDPPFSLFGLPRIVSHYEHLSTLFREVSSNHNGLCFCTGSLGAKKNQDMNKILTDFSDRVHFVHLRNVSVEEDGSFYEANHLEGEADMYEIMKTLLKEQRNRVKKGHTITEIPFRPDHGHLMLDDLSKKTNPGYSAIGRLRGLAELRGLMYGIERNVS